MTQELPKALDIEPVVLGAVIDQAGSVSDCLQFIKTEDVFFDPTHRAIFKAILELYEASEPIDMFTVSQKLRKSSEESPNGHQWVYEVTTLTRKAVQDVKHLDRHMKILVEMYIRRELAKSMNAKVKALMDPGTDVFAEVQAFETDMARIVDGNSRGNAVSMKQAVGEAIEVMSQTSEGGLTGIPSGLSSLDKVTGGFQNTDLIIIAARPSMGKTAFVGSIMSNAAINHGASVGFFSMEMSVLQITNRLISKEANVALSAIKNKNVHGHTLSNIAKETASLASAPIYIDDTPALTILEMKSKARRMKNRYKIDMLIVDYLQLGVAKAGNREQEVSKLSAAMKAIAKELNIPVIALSQLSRAVESRGDKRPQLSDLRDSGSIEQDADIVMFLYRAEYYGLNEIEIDGDTYSSQGVGEVIIAKHRNGDLGSEILEFDGNKTTWRDLQVTPF